METVKKTNVIAKIANDLKESTLEQHRIDKENFAAVKADSKANFEKATTPNPGFVEFKQAKGLKAKAKVVVKNIKAGAEQSKLDVGKRQASIQPTYEQMLKQQREKRQATINTK